MIISRFFHLAAKGIISFFFGSYIDGLRYVLCYDMGLAAEKLCSVFAPCHTIYLITTSVLKNELSISLLISRLNYPKAVENFSAFL